VLLVEQQLPAGRLERQRVFVLVVGRR